MKVDLDSRAVMTVQQVADYLQVNKLTVYRYIHAGSLPAVRLGRAFRVRRQDVDHFLEGHRVSAAKGARSTTRAGRPAHPPAPHKHTEEIYVGPSREEQRQPRDALVSSNPIDWVIRGLH